MAIYRYRLFLPLYINIGNACAIYRYGDACAIYRYMSVRLSTSDDAEVTQEYVYKKFVFVSETVHVFSS